MAERKLALHTRILIAMGAGVFAGLAAHALGPVIGDLGGLTSVIDKIAGLIGDLFLRALRFIAVPIVLCSLVLGAASLEDVRRLSRIGTRTIVLYLTTTASAVTLGLLLANITQPGTWVGKDVRDQLAAEGSAGVAGRLATAETTDIWTTVLTILPDNPFAALARAEMLQVVVLSVLLGLMLTRIPRERAAPVLAVFNGINDAVLAMVQVVMGLAPIAVFCLVARVVGSLGADVLAALAMYVATVLVGLALVTFGVYAALLRFLSPVHARPFFRAIAPVQLLAFSSSSSNATLPLTMQVARDELGMGDEVASFVLPLGATVNMDGTALYQGVAALFIAQLYGIDLTFTDQATIVATATLASIGTAGVPGVGLVMLVMVLQSVGMPEETMAGGLAIIFGVDRVLDMCRTATNVTGDLVVGTVIAHHEGVLTGRGLTG